MELDSTTMVIIGTLLAGVIGAVAFFAMPQPEKKKRTGSDGQLKQKGPFRLPYPLAQPALTVSARLTLAENWYSQ